MKTEAMGGGKAMLKTVEGEPLTVTAKGGAVWLTDDKGGMSQVTIANVYQSNGVIHVDRHGADALIVCAIPPLRGRDATSPRPSGSANRSNR